MSGCDCDEPEVFCSHMRRLDMRYEIKPAVTSDGAPTWELVSHDEDMDGVYINVLATNPNRDVLVKAVEHLGGKL